MPANKNAMTRYKILDDLLSNRYHDYSLDDLTSEESSTPNTNELVDLLRCGQVYPNRRRMTTND